MHPSSDLLETLRRDGLLVRDKLLPQAVFDGYARRVRSSWKSREGWVTRVKGPGEAKALPIQPSDKVREIGVLLDAYSSSNPESFSYLYHSLHESNDNACLIKDIAQDTIAAWQDFITHLIVFPYQTNFSLTAYTPHCRLTSHTDYSTDTDPYRLTLLLYFGGEGDDIVPLYFNFAGHQHRVTPQRNRSVLFVPTPETEHWIEPVPHSSTQSVRLAFSGWLI